MEKPARLWDIAEASPIRSTTYRCALALEFLLIITATLALWSFGLVDLSG
jgi:hypothetical protein